MGGACLMAGEDGEESGKGKAVQLSSDIRHRVWYLVGSIFLIDAYSCLCEISWTIVQEEGNVKMYGLPRCFLVLGFLLAGFLADYKEGKYLDAGLLGILGLAFSGSFMTDHVIARLAVFYIMAAFTIIYMNLQCWYLAPDTKESALWASFARIFSSVEGFLSLLFIRFLGRSEFYYTMAMAIFFLAILFVIGKKSLQGYQPNGVENEKDKKTSSVNGSNTELNMQESLQNMERTTI